MGGSGQRSSNMTSTQQHSECECDEAMTCRACNKKPNAKAQAKAKKAQHDDLEALQITFYEIESWIEKTTPVLNRMTKELEKASVHFDKKKKERHQENGISSGSSTSQPPSKSASDEQQRRVQWTFSFEPQGSMSLETNITSIDQLVDAVQKIKLLAKPEDLQDQENQQNALDSQDDQDKDIGDRQGDVDPTLEFWSTALYRRPEPHFFDKGVNETARQVADQVSPQILQYICQVYWDCLHPKFSADWTTFWHRSDDPKRNQLCVESALAIVFLHVVRHNKTICPNAPDIARVYFERARELLTDCFDTPDCSTIEALMNLAMFLVLCKKHSQARLYMGLGIRIMLELGINKRNNLPVDRVLRKRYIKAFLVVYYNDLILAAYMVDQAQIDDKACDIDFYEMITLNEQLMEHGEAKFDDKTIAKETFFVHLLELAKIGKKAQALTEERAQNKSEPNSRWIKKIAVLESSLHLWYQRLPEYLRVDPSPSSSSSSSNSSVSSNQSYRMRRQQQQPYLSPGLTPSPPDTASPLDLTQCMDAQQLKDQSALLLMLQYQTQWILLHKSFLPASLSRSPTTSPAADAMPRNNFKFSSSSNGNNNNSANRYANLPHAICTDAANRIVVIADLITQQYGWCVFQQFVNCLYQAATIHCRNTLSRDEGIQRNARAMIKRILKILGNGSIHYQGLPADLTVCLQEFLTLHGMHMDVDGQDTYGLESGDVGDLWGEDASSEMPPTGIATPNAPRSQELLQKSLLADDGLDTLMMEYHVDGLPVKMEPDDVFKADMSEQQIKNWRCKFSSTNIAHLTHRSIP
ncbi:hypothetical protein INT43_001714 [Umbelopsis isabellina]|uniref:Transcription factor domain-containing protein n=1 Tax=Mortierella isabellina TaxID=91625 RepID=A0A8H7UGC1_MORIS|nr:hypothetical protein INT43_001714 [Umbelopsis isabellina]